MHSGIGKVIKEAADLGFEERFALFREYYGRETHIREIRDFCKKNRWDKAFMGLCVFIRSNKRALRLDLMETKDRFTDSFLNDYRIRGRTNHCVIRTPFQVRALVKEFGEKIKERFTEEFSRLEEIAGQLEYSVICVDSLKDRRRSFSELIHDLNAWLISGCAAGKNSRLSVTRDWREFLPGNGLNRKLDELFSKYGKTDQ